MANGYFERGEMYDILFSDGLPGEMAAHRPGVIVSSDRGNTTSPSVLMIYTTTTTTTDNRRISVNYEFTMNGWRNFALCNQIVTVNKNRLKKFYGKLPESDMREIDRCLREAMALGRSDEAALKEKDAEIADRDVLIGDLKSEVAGVKAEAAKKDEEIASLKMEIEMWQKCYGRCMDMLVDTKVSADLQRRTAAPVVAEPVKIVDPEEPVIVPPVIVPVDPPEPVKLLDVNSCTATALKKAGFSLAVARKIVEGRPYKSTEDLKNVNGMKASLFRILEPKLCCNPVVVAEPEKPVEVVEQPQPEEPKPVRKQEPDPGFEKLNVNTCTAKEFCEVTGLCRATGYSVVGYRKKNGPYTKLEDLLNVANVGPGTLQRVGHLLEV